jgi:23S rRNA pseudouridine2605 synthase
MRIQKAITQSGVASRRQAEAIIQEGRVTVNGETILHPAFEVSGTDKICIDGDPIPKPERLYYFAYHKPKGLIVDRNDPQHRPSVFSHLENLPVRVESVDKLDIQTAGLLLLTNDGILAHDLSNPSMNIPRKYLVKVWKRPDDRKLKLIRKGIALEDGKTKPMKIRIVDQTDTDNVWMEVLVTENRNRLLKRVFEHVGHPVSKIKRISVGTVSIGRLESSEVRVLTAEEIQRLKDVSAGIDPRNAGGPKYKKGFARPKPKTRKNKKKRDIHRPSSRRR